MLSLTFERLEHLCHISPCEVAELNFLGGDGSGSCCVAALFYASLHHSEASLAAYSSQLEKVSESAELTTKQKEDIHTCEK